MYESHWQLEKKPFENTPDPRFFYYSRDHEEGLSRMIYAIRARKGAALLTAESGCGKTLLSRVLLKELDADQYRSAIICNPRLSPSELLDEIIHQFNGNGRSSPRPGLLRHFNNILPFMRSRAYPSQDVADPFDNTFMYSTRIQQLRAFDDILRQNRVNNINTLIVIDEAQTINHKNCFEELRLLLNYQSDDDFLVTLVLLGQPELKSMISDMPQLKQRLAVRYHIKPLTEDETEAYIQHRLRTAGARQQIFSDDVYPDICRLSSGIPRRINNVCDMSLLVGASRKLNVISRDLILEVGKDLEEIPA